MGRGSSKAGKSRAVVKKQHPVVTSVNGITDGKAGSNVAWIKKMVPGISDEEAEATRNAAIGYTGPAFHSFHLEKEGFKDDIKRLNDLIDSPNTPVYGKDSYRGLNLRYKDMPLIEAAIKSGRWKESGITSFSAKRSVAENFADTKNKKTGVSVIVTNKGHTKGMPMKHLSVIKGEDEVVQSSSTMKKGMKILNSSVKWVQNGKDKRKIYYIDVDDSQ